MAWKCDVCGQNIHLKKIDGKNYPIQCPLEKFKVVKTFYTPEIKQMLSFMFLNEIPLSNSPSDLALFAEKIPEISQLSKYVQRYDDNAFTKTLVIQSSLEKFFTNFTRVLIELYEDNRIHYVDSPELPSNNQFNYLWLSPTTLRECYFREGRAQSRFKSMTELGNPSLVIYPLGNVMSVKHGAWGDILLDLITHRESMGKPTWVVKSKAYSSCPEISSSDKLRSFLNSARIPLVKIDIEDEDRIPTSLISEEETTSSSEGISASNYI